MYKEVYYQELAHVITAAKSRNPLSASSEIQRDESESLSSGETGVPAQLPGRGLLPSSPCLFRLLPLSVQALDKCDDAPAPGKANCFTQ